MALEKLGIERIQTDQIDPQKLADYPLARVVAVNRDNYLIHNGKAVLTAEITGKMLLTASSPLDYPAVGDWVHVQYFDDDTFAIIHEIFPRNSVLKRKTPGKKIDFQVICANVDTAFIVQSLDRDFNLRRLERYLVMIYEAGIQPAVLLSKSDLLSPEELQEKCNAIEEISPETEIFPFSNVSGVGVPAVTDRLKAAHTYCLIGSSGVGKTTLLNVLLKDERFETGEVREKDQRGKHTTTRRQLIILDNGALLIDTPGMRELGNIGVESGISETFSEIAEIAENCRFNDCTHSGEKGCAVLEALESGEISNERYESYMKIQRESAYNERTYLEKRQRDKELGKLYKSIMKGKPNKR
ncbi:MAG: ribosome small subunit-dependent GTPase A [Calditrichae bacterium]|nr:ribosome small subunit-dependent GTPase A [Calditrichia bacterium]